MKVYVEELPKSCSKCEWFTENHCGSEHGRNFCLLARMPFYNTEKERETTRGQHKDSLSDFDCPLQTITDHDKQVRKQVCDEIRNRSAKSYSGYAFNLGKDVYSYTVCDFVLDQIEKGVKDDK